MRDILFRKFSSDNLGISFFYKSSLVLERNHEDNDEYNLSLKEESLQFNVIKLSPEANVGLKIFGLENALKSALNEDEILIEDVKIDQCKINGEKTACATTNCITKAGKMKIQRILISHQGNGYLLACQNLEEKFESSASKETFSTILETFKFLET